jgi:hypothetical protein
MKRNDPDICQAMGIIRDHIRIAFLLGFDTLNNGILDDIMV